MNAALKPEASTRNRPPTAPLAFRVGVVGHRPDRLDNHKLDQLAATLRVVLGAVKDECRAASVRLTSLYDGAHPILRAISSLAEGTDRIFAETALALNFELCCVLPFPKAEFAKDFESEKALETNSLARFEALFDQAKIRFELDGTRAEAGEAYGVGGRVVLNQSDLLFVVWDELGRAASDLLVSEVLDWRSVVFDQPLHTPRISEGLNEASRPRG
jgi:hypothetical protein